ncbi:MAG: hypothetical protein QM800_14590 [Paludibacter sp.]
MENKPAKKQTLLNQNKVSAEPQTYTISEITAEYKILNENLVTALDQFELIFETGYLESSDIKLFKKLDITFEKRSIDAAEIDTHGESIFESILETVFEESLEKARLLFGFDDPGFWYIKQDSYNKVIIKTGVEVSFVLKFFNRLFNTLIYITDLCEYIIPNEFESFESVDAADSLSFYDFDETVRKAKKITDLRDKLNYYHSEIAEKELFAVQHDDEPYILELCREFIHKCNLAIDITENHLNKSTKYTQKTQAEPMAIIQPVETNTQSESNPAIETELPPETIAKGNPAFTTSRQVLAIYYLLNEIDRKGINQVDKTEKAKFIEFLTGKNYNNIYKALSNPFKGLDRKNPKNFLNDMEYISSHFEKLGLQSIVQKINADAIPEDN